MMKTIFRNEGNFKKKVDFNGRQMPDMQKLKLNPDEQKALGDYWAVRRCLLIGASGEAEKILAKMQPQGRKMEGRYYALAAGAIALYYKAEKGDRKMMVKIFDRAIGKMHQAGSPKRTDNGGMVALVEMMAVAGEEGLARSTMAKLGPLSCSQAQMKADAAKLHVLPDC